MNHGLNNSFLYTAYKITSTFKDSNNKSKSIVGTCFFVKNVRGKIVLITNRHCIEADYNDVRYKDYKIHAVTINGKFADDIKEAPSETISLFVTDFEILLPDNYKDDIVCLNNLTFIVPDSKEKFTNIQYHIPYEYIADEDRINDKLSVCDFVAFPGYPQWHDKLNDLPIFRSGTIASDPRFNYSYSGNDEGSRIAYEAFSYGGSSGSPVFALQKGFSVSGALKGGYFREAMLIGINAGHLNVDGPNAVHSGISFFFKSSIIIRLINKIIN